MRYKKKQDVAGRPLPTTWPTVEAVQWFPGKPVAGVKVSPDGEEFFEPYIETLAGPRLMAAGDWVVTLPTKYRTMAMTDREFMENYEEVKP